MIHSSKIDWWLAGLTILGLGGGVAAVLAAAMQGEDAVFPLVLMLLVAALVLWVFSSTQYEISPQHLVMRSGPFRWRINLDSIQQIQPSHNPLSAPALSLDRLRIDYILPNGKERFALISPRDKAAFLQDLQDVVEGLDVDGDQAIRRESKV